MRVEDVKPGKVFRVDNYPTRSMRLVTIEVLSVGNMFVTYRGHNGNRRESIHRFATGHFLAEDEALSDFVVRSERSLASMRKMIVDLENAIESARSLAITLRKPTS